MEGKKKSDSEFLSYNLMWNYGKKKKILTLVLSETKFLNKTKNHNPPLQVKWSVPYMTSQGEKTKQKHVCIDISIKHKLMYT